ncbi:MAG TPA: RDD family protein [Candidatus Acidoferrum sp.]
MFCSKCGAAISADSAFCTSCGTPHVRTALASPAAVTVPPNVGVAGYSAARGQLMYGGFWLRFVAYLVDSVAMGIAVFAIFIPLVAITGAAAHLHGLEDMQRRGQPDPAVVAAFITLFVTFVGAALLITWLYHAYFESSSWQATPGKRVMNLYVTDLSGQPITFLNATGRHFAKIVTGLIPLFIGYIMAAFTERRQALHDMIASTLVLRR